MQAANNNVLQILERLLMAFGGTAAAIIFLFSLFSLISRNAPFTATSIDQPIQFWAVSFLADGKTVATCGGPGSPYDMPRRGELVLWDWKAGKEEFVRKEQSSVRSLASSPSGRLVTTGDFDGYTKLISPITGRVIGITHSQGGVNSLAFSTDNEVVVGCLDGTITIWNTIDKTARILVIPDEVVLHVAVSHNSHAVVATTRKGRVYVFDLLTNGTPKELQAYQGSPTDQPNAEGVAFAPDGRSFATACLTRVRLWEYPVGKIIEEWTDVTNINSIAFSPDGQTIATVDSNGILALWDPVTGERDKTTQAHSGISFCVVFSPDGKHIATIGRDDYTVKIWDARSLTLLKTLCRSNLDQSIN